MADDGKWNGLRRTEWKRKPRKPMKRTGHIKPSKKPRRGKDSDVVDAYVRANPQCELVEILHEHGGPVWRQILGGWCGKIELEVHHIALGANKRRDHLSNIIRLSPVVHHGWGHDNFPNDLFVLSCWRKSTKGELDLSLLGEIMRKPDMRGYIEVLPIQNRWVEEFRGKLLDSIEGH